MRLNYVTLKDTGNITKNEDIALLYVTRLVGLFNAIVSITEVNVKRSERMITHNEL